MTETFEIRRLNAGDVPKCRAVLDSLDGWFEQEESNRAYEQSLYRLPAAVATVDGKADGQTNGEVVGFLALTEHSPQSYEIEVMGVEEAHHRKGIGRALINWAEDWCRARGVTWLHVKTRGPSTPDPEYAQTRKFYRACGFDPLFESLTHWGPDDAALTFVKHLAVGAGPLFQRDHGAELDLVNRQAQTLREEVDLDTHTRAGLQGVPYLLSGYLNHMLDRDEVKRMVLATMIRDATANHIDCAEDELYRLLTSQSMPFQPETGETPTSLSQMKAVQTATRFSDMIFLPRDADLFVIGDTHGDPTSTQVIIDEVRASRAFANGAYVVFMGDYANNGVRSRENVRLVLSFQRNHPDSVVLMSGNHDFRESCGTALNEYFQVHWNRLSDAEILAMPDERVQDRLPSRGRHYGHLRLELMRSMGFENGEKTYAAFAAWGERLPVVCICGDLMMSHSLGKIEGTHLRLADLLHAKRDDAANMRRLGTEAWNARRESAHSNLVNNRQFTADLVTEFSNVLDVEQFAVGHTHYRSGDTVNYGDAAVTTIASSDPFSPDSGHYMYYEMKINRAQQHAENLTSAATGAYYLQFAATPDGKHVRQEMPITVVQYLK